MCQPWIHGFICLFTNPLMCLIIHTYDDTMAVFNPGATCGFHIRSPGVKTIKKRSLPTLYCYSNVIVEKREKWNCPNQPLCVVRRLCRGALRPSSSSPGPGGRCGGPTATSLVVCIDPTGEENERAEWSCFVFVLGGVCSPCCWQDFRRDVRSALSAPVFVFFGGQRDSSTVLSVDQDSTNAFTNGPILHILL